MSNTRRVSKSSEGLRDFERFVHILPTDREQSTVDVKTLPADESDARLVSQLHL